MKNQNNKGQSFFEVLIALAMITLILTALVSLATVSVRNSTRTKNETLATRYSQEGIEWLRSQRDVSWTAFSGKAGPLPNGQTYCISDLNFDSVGTCSTNTVIAGTNLRREAVLTNDSATSVLANVKTYWSDGQGYHEVSTQTNFTEWK